MWDPPPPQRDTQAIRRPYAGPDGGSTPTALAPTDEQIHKQHIRKPVGNGLKKDTGAAERYNQLLNQYARLLAEYRELSDRKT